MKHLTILILTLISLSLFAEDGSHLWLRFSDTKVEKVLFSEVIANPKVFSADEFRLAWKQMSGNDLPVLAKAGKHSLIIGTGKDKQIRALEIASDLKNLGTEGYLIRSINKGSATVVAANTEAGLLYGTYHLLRLLQTEGFSGSLNIKEIPSYNFRILDHWDNLDGSVERGYAGHSIFWHSGVDSLIITSTDKARWEAYARANASIGINGTVLNNVNASPKVLTKAYLQKVKAIAEVLRPFHIRVYLAVNFASPQVIGSLPTSDPLDKNVKKWWTNKVKEIYQSIPDFGGFLVKASSEGQPGPQDFGRTHADGANMLADALKPFGGIVMWRAFVYEPGDDRVKLAYKEFHKLDGQFRDNVIIQVKNGPVDFQPREPFNPLFGAMKKTALMPEWQITQEYTGQSNHLCFLSTMWEEFLKTDTYCEGKGSTIDKITEGKIYPQKYTAIAGVANIGLDKNWCGHHFAQANWYAFGRLAWNNQLSSEQIADEWIKMTFSIKKKDNCQLSIKKMMLSSRETLVDYMMPLGLHHIFAWEHHYGPEPWCDIPGARPDWLPKYYHKADSIGLGFNRTISGSDAVSQYYSPLREELNDLSTCPEKYLLWFHHVPWDYKMKDGKTLWDELCYKYDTGVQEVREYQKIWDKVEPDIDPQRFAEVQSKLRIQARDAVWWRDACLLYFQTFSRRPIPYELERPVNDLDSLMKIKLNMKSHN